MLDASPHARGRWADKASNGHSSLVPGPSSVQFRNCTLGSLGSFGSFFARPATWISRTSFSTVLTNMTSAGRDWFSTTDSSARASIFSRPGIVATAAMMHMLRLEGVAAWSGRSFTRLSA